MSDESESLKEHVETWMVGQMPIIQMHGGNNVVCKTDMESGEVVVKLRGACAGCGVLNAIIQDTQPGLIMMFSKATDVQAKVPSSGDHDGNTIEGDRGGELQCSDEGPRYF